MKILLTNDDGIDAFGLQKLYRVLENQAPHIELWLIAPDQNRSGCSSAMTFNHPLSLKKQDKRVYTTNGTPADCVNIALHCQEFPKFNLVVSGINQGENIGLDVHYSGTIGAARQAVVHGIKGIALSSACNEVKNDIYTSSAEWFSQWLQDHFEKLNAKIIYNLNFPHRPLIVTEKATHTDLSIISYCDQYDLVLEKNENWKDYRITTKKFKKPRAQNISTNRMSDMEAIENKQISLTEISVLGLLHDDATPAKKSH